MLPGLKKTIDGVSKMNFAEMDDELWQYWLLKMNLEVQSEERVKTISYPDRGFKRRETMHSASWKESLPPLISSTWWRVKWASKATGMFRSSLVSDSHSLGVRYRAWVVNLTVVRNSWTNICRVEFQYAIQHWNIAEKKWYSCW
jgi:hypothetical protein